MRNSFPFPRLVRFFPLVLWMAASLSCSTPPKENEVAPFENSGPLETLVILGSNDIHGALAPEKLRTKDTPPIEYEKGGAVYFATQVRILKKQYGDHLLLLDAGDEFQGSIDSNSEEGRPMVRFFNELGYTAASIGNHEFDFGPEGTTGLSRAKSVAEGLDLRGTLKARISEARYTYLAANIWDKKSHSFPGIPGTRSSMIVSAGRLKVGIVGLTTLDTPTTTRSEFVQGLEFRDMASTALEESKKLRSEGADIVLLLTHSGLFCNIPVAEDRGGRGGIVKSESDFQTGCESDGEVPSLLRKLPKGTFDAVVSGHTHSLVHHWIEGVPVIQGGTRNSFYNLIYLTYDWNAKKVRPEKARIEGPLPICPKIFANQKTCNGEVPAPPGGRGELITPKIRGVEIQSDPEMALLLRPTFLATEAKKEEVVGYATRPIPHTREVESPLGNFVTDAVRDSIHADVGIMNPGGIRVDWQSGPIRYADVFRSLPFDNYIAKLSLTGKELKLLLRITHGGARGFFSTSGLRIRAIRREELPNSSDLDGNKHIDPWELDRLIEATFSNGNPIEDSKIYTVATLDFLVGGGDGLGWFMSRIPKDRITPVAGPVLREAVVAYLKKTTRPEGLNSASEPLVDPAHPRLILESRPSSKSTGRSRRAKKNKRVRQ
ncbi:MAG: bifunctional metallophosphatase/5'-nucleotidase [Cryobacterium sp.]|nr:bifunctional metallophosphatase/5'-nucleotidase [Oligoflexia bacterium]